MKPETSSAEPSSYRFYGFALEPAARALRDPRGEPVRLPARAFDILLTLVRHAGRPVSKDALMKAAWRDRIVEENSLSRAISSLRTALGDDAAAPRFIATIPGEGYQFIAPIELPGTAGDGYSPATPPPTRPAAASAPARDARRPRRAAGGLGLAVLALLVAGSAWLWSRKAPDPAPETAGGASLMALEILTDFPGSHGDPTLSPDGEWLAFTSDASGVNQIWIISLADRVPRQLTRGERAASAPAWSPGGQQIVYAVEGDGIWSMHPLGEGSPRRIIDLGAFPAFGPDGRWLVYERGREIWRARNDGSDARPIDGVPERRFVQMPALPAVSPDGREIVYFLAEHAVFGDFWRVAATGGEPRRLTDDLVPGGGASWLPGGEAVVVASSRGGRWNLWRMPLDGADPRALTSGVGDDSDPVVSPDGEWVVYTNQLTRWQLMSSDPATGTHELTLERRDAVVLPSVSPDGRTVAYFTGDPLRSNLVSVDLGSRVAVPVTNNPKALATLPTWSGDGRRLYYFDGHSQGLRRIDLDGRNDIEAVPDFHWQLGQNFLSFDPTGDRYVFHDRDPETGASRAIVRSLDGAPDVVFDDPDLRQPSWSRDGTRLVGFDRTGVITVCEVASRVCQSLSSAGKPVTGYQPRWSRDGERVFFRRRTDDPTRHTLWSYDPATDRVSQRFEFGPIEPNSVHYDVAEGDRIIWAKTLADESKIWRGRLRPAQLPDVP